MKIKVKKKTPREPNRQSKQTSKGAKIPLH